MRPFGCHVTNLNTIDHFGKLNGKADEGFFVGYSLNSKAFRVFNSRTRIVEENLHIRFSGSTPNVVGTQSNGFASTKASDNADPKISQDDGSKPLSDDGKNVDEDSRKYSEGIDQEKEDNVNSTNNVNIAGNVNIVSSTVNAAGINEMMKVMMNSVLTMNNLDTTIQVNPNPTTRIHKDYPFDQVIGDLQSATQTRKISKNLEEHGFVMYYSKRTNHKDDEDDDAVVDMNNLDTTIQVNPIPITRIHKDYPLDQEEPKKVIYALKDPSWIEAMQEELLQFKLQEDERGIMIRNKARLVAQGYTQEEGINYDEVFAPVARIEAIRLFLAYASFKDFVVYQMDVKSAFLYGKIEEEVYVCQPPGFEDPNFPDRVYKVEKALYGLHQAPRAWYETLSTYLLDNGFQRGKIDKTLFIKRYKGDILLMSSMGELTFFLGLQVKQKKDGIFISQDKYVDEILKKFRFTKVKTASTPMETQKPLLKDEDGKEVDVHMYRSMIGSLMYLTSSRPDIMFAVCACARYQVNPKVSHLHAVKRIFRYLKGQPKLGLWYPKDSPFDLVAYTDSDYAGASLDRKSTIGGCQFLGCRLISWQCKKQTVVANSTTEAEYVAASSCCGQVLWIQNQLLDYGYNFMHTKIFIDNNRKAKKSVRLMMEKLFRMELELILSTVIAKTINGEVQLHALVDGKKIIITESTVRRDLQLEDEEGVEFLPNSTIFEQLTLMALVLCDGLSGYDWSDQAEEGPNYELMAYSSSSSDSKVSNNSNCSKSCLKTIETLKSQYDQLHKDFKKSELMILAYKSGLESVEEKLEVYKRAQEEARNNSKRKGWNSISVVKFENASKSLNKLIESQIVDNCKKGLGYNVVPPPYTGNFMPPTPNLSFTCLDEFVNKPVIENRKSDEEVSKVVRKSNDSLIIEDWVSDSEEENVSQTKTENKIVKPRMKIEFVKPKQQEKIARKTVKQVEKHRQNTHSPRGNQRNWNNMTSQRLESNFEMFNKACYVCGRFDHLQDNPQRDIQDQGVIDSGCSRHMTGNMSYLTDYEEIDGGYKVDEDSRKDSEGINQEKEDNVNSTNNVNAASTNEVNVVGGKTSIKLTLDPNMPELEDYSIFEDDEDVGVKADMHNLDTTIQVSPIPTIRIHKDHPIDQVVRDLQSATQTRRMSKSLEEHGFVSTIQQRTNHKDLQNCLFA
ncbi:putative ribonuclease H-like domain-containing protein [Tanacetum coccineum]